METLAKPTKWSENLLFAFLGALSAVILSLGTFGAVDLRAPASQEGLNQSKATPSLTPSDLEPRVFISID